jgi:hypothetical protein
MESPPNADEGFTKECDMVDDQIFTPEMYQECAKKLNVRGKTIAVWGPQDGDGRD